MASTPPQTAAPRRPVHAVTVVAAEQVTPNMRRLTFVGDALTGMAAPLPAQWLKVIAPGPDGVTRVNRAYTIRKLDAGRGALDIDFVLHGEAGPVSAWASRAGVGHAAQLGTPRGGHRIDLAAPWRLFAGDETALPAIATMLEALPVGDVPTRAIIEVPSRADAQPVSCPPGVAVEWLARDRLGAQYGSLLVQRLAISISRAVPARCSWPARRPPSAASARTSPAGPRTPAWKPGAIGVSARPTTASRTEGLGLRRKGFSPSCDARWGWARSSPPTNICERPVRQAAATQAGRRMEENRRAYRPSRTSTPLGPALRLELAVCRLTSLGRKSRIAASRSRLPSIMFSEWIARKVVGADPE